MKSTFEHAMSFGHEALDEGDLEEALGRFIAAGEEAKRGNEQDHQAEANQMAGVVFRLRGDLSKSENKLLRAKAISIDLVLLGKILRDLMMTQLELWQAHSAPEKLGAAESNIRESNRLLGRILGNDSPERLASYGFFGRLRWVVNPADGLGADIMLQVARSLYKRHDTYELNNLIWLLRASVKSRFRWGPRAIRLAVRKRNKRRLVEAVVLTFAGEHVYRFVKKLLKSRT